MINIDARNVEEGWAVFKIYARDANHHFQVVAPRGISTLEMKDTVCTTYYCPQECVLLDPVRDCNPFFHLYEALWILAGHGDVERVAFYTENVKQFSDDGRTFNGAYGVRLRSHFGVDQIEELIKLLKEDPDSRRGVLQLWEPADLVGRKLDHPCNTTIFCKLREAKLHMTVCNRSNDAVWGCYGANAVQFSILQQYIAAALNVPTGKLRQVSDSLHVYTDEKWGAVWRRCSAAHAPMLQDYSYKARGLKNDPLVLNFHRFNAELEELLDYPTGRVPDYWVFKEPFLGSVAHPMFLSHQRYRDGDLNGALDILKYFDEYGNAWLVAAKQWLLRRMKLA